jgi:hypothetical protein
MIIFNFMPRVRLNSTICGDASEELVLSSSNVDTKESTGPEDKRTV